MESQRHVLSQFIASMSKKYCTYNNLVEFVCNKGHCVQILMENAERLLCYTCPNFEGKCWMVAVLQVSKFFMGNVEWLMSYKCPNFDGKCGMVDELQGQKLDKFERQNLRGFTEWQHKSLRELVQWLICFVNWCRVAVSNGKSIYWVPSLFVFLFYPFFSSCLWPVDCG